MDAKHSQLEEKLEELLKQASVVASQLQAAEQGPGVPHYDQIELPAHAVGQRLSRMVQSDRARHVAADASPQETCPDCGRDCPAEAENREVHSMDGQIELTENVAHCCRCRRSFFPST